MNKYLLDSNVFIEAKNRYYGFDICPGFWASIVELYAAGRVYCIEQVRNELLSQGDALDNWLQSAIAASFFSETNEHSTIKSYQQLISWVYSEPQFEDEAREEFASVADGWVIAYAHAKGMKVVTHEKLAPHAKKRVPMPNVCEQFGVAYVDTFEMLRDLKVSYVKA